MGKPMSPAEIDELLGLPPKKLGYGEDMCACCGDCFETFGACHVSRCFACRMRCNPGHPCAVAKKGGE
jgi:hypothetical protein